MDEGTDVIIKLMTTFGPWGLVGWYMWHNVTYTIPGIVKDFRETNLQQQADFRADLAEERRLFSETLQRQERKHDKLVDVLRQLVAKMGQGQLEIPSDPDSGTLRKDELDKKKR